MARADANDVWHELEAMRVVAEVLASLDGSARERVLRWAADKFGQETAAFTAVGSTAATPSVRPEADIDDLRDIFDQPAAARLRGREPVEALTSDLGAEFPRLVLGWEGA